MSPWKQYKQEDSGATFFKVLKVKIQNKTKTKQINKKRILYQE